MTLGRATDNNIYIVIQVKNWKIGMTYIAWDAEQLIIRFSNSEYLWANYCSSPAVANLSDLRDHWLPTAVTSLHDILLSCPIL